MARRLRLSFKDARTLKRVTAATGFRLKQQPYKPNWDIERAIKDGFERVLYVYRCVDAIATNQARTKIELRRGSKDGQVIDGSREDLIRLLNLKPNDYETATQFRYRVSCQLLLSKQGVFVELVRSNGGGIASVHLLPAGRTAPVPGTPDADGKIRRFVDGYRVDYADGGFDILKPEQVLWIRKPHPTNPYFSSTPLEAAGIAADIDFYARLFNRNFLLNDGRPGGILAVKGELSTEDAAELKARFSGGPAAAGRTSVIEADEVEWVDSSVNPRDAQYTQCAVPETPFTMADGTRRRADTLVAGDTVYAWDEDERTETTARVSAVWRNPSTPLVRVTTTRGRVLTTTLHHPYWAARRRRTPGGRYPVDSVSKLAGWYKADELELGDYLRVGFGYAPPGGDTVTGWTYGALAGDGCLCAGPRGHNGAQFACADDGVLAAMAAAVAERGGELRSQKTKPYGYYAVGAFNDWVRSTSVYGKTKTRKHVADEVFIDGIDTWRGFLAGYTDTDGTVTHGGYANPTVRWTSISQALIEGCQHLLAGLGVQSTVSSHARGPGFPTRHETTWVLEVFGRTDIARFATLVGPLMAHAEKRERLAALATVSGATYHEDQRTFDRVRSIEYLEGETIGVEVADLHTHVTSGLITHNSMAATKLDLLLAFGVPESILGNASGRTYDNASTEEAVFWRVTMIPHCEMIDEAFDQVTAGGITDNLFLAHDTSEIAPLRRDERERHAKALQEFQAGAINLDEYREETGRKALDVPGSRVHWLPTGKIGIGQPDDEAYVAKMMAAGQGDLGGGGLPQGASTDFGSQYQQPPALDPVGGGWQADAAATQLDRIANGAGNNTANGTMDPRGNGLALGVKGLPMPSDLSPAQLGAVLELIDTHQAA